MSSIVTLILLRILLHTRTHVCAEFHGVFGMSQKRSFLVHCRRAGNVCSLSTDRLFSWESDSYFRSLADEEYLSAGSCRPASRSTCWRFRCCRSAISVSMAHLAALPASTPSMPVCALRLCQVWGLASH